LSEIHKKNKKFNFKVLRVAEIILSREKYLIAELNKSQTRAQP